MLWDLIRDFFVIHVFGGYTSEGILYSASVGRIESYLDGVFDETLPNAEDLLYKVSSFNNEGLYERYLTLGDWLSTTATIISITIIVVLCAMFIYKIVRLVGGLIR